jgi:segregation and condensation protein B
MELTKIIEALLFAYQEPLSIEHMSNAVRDTAKEIIEAAGPEAGPDAIAVQPLVTVTNEQVAETLKGLIASYAQDGRAFTVVERPAGWRLAARIEYAEWCRSLYPGKKPQRLSQPALETLAIIAYRQPITKAGIEAVRGVSVDGMVQLLLDRALIRAEGRADLPGKPMLYGTTDAFLDHFGVRSVEELPNSQELRRVKLPEASSEAPTAAHAEPEHQQLNFADAPAAS